MKPRVTLIMVVILVGGWLRFSDLGADPPIPLLDRTWGEGPSGCYLSDEGWYNSNALRWILGYEPTFPPEQINAARLTPLFYHLQTGIFWALDPSLSVARLIAAFSGFLLLFIFPLMETNPRRRLLLLVLVALDFVLITHSRLALPDMLGILCVILAGHAAMRDRPHLAAGAIIAAFAAKPIYMPAAILGAAASIGRTVRLPFFLSTCFMGAIFLVAVYVPGWNEIVSLTERLAPKRTLHPAGVLDYLWDGVWFYHWGPLIPLALLGLFDKERDRYYRWAVGTLAGAFIVLVSQRYQPLRYHLTLVLPAYLLAIRVTRWSGWWPRIAGLALSSLLLMDSYRLLSSTTSFTMRDAARDARSRIHPREVTVLGHLADTFALEAHWKTIIPPVDHEPGSARDRIGGAGVTHLLCHFSYQPSRWMRRYLGEGTASEKGANPGEGLETEGKNREAHSSGLVEPAPGVADLPPGVIERGRWDVMGNYYSDSPVVLYLATPVDEHPGVRPSSRRE